MWRMLFWGPSTVKTACRWHWRTQVLSFWKDCPSRSPKNWRNIWRWLNKGSKQVCLNMWCKLVLFVWVFFLLFSFRCWKKKEFLHHHLFIHLAYKRNQGSASFGLVLGNRTPQNDPGLSSSEKQVLPIYSLFLKAIHVCYYLLVYPSTRFSPRL